jgi:hypothetical protein
MATAAENLTLTIERICQQLADLEANPKPSYSVSGPKGSRSVSWAEHRTSLTAQLEKLLTLRVKLAGPFTVLG